MGRSPVRAKIAIYYFLTEGQLHVWATAYIGATSLGDTIGCSGTSDKVTRKIVRGYIVNSSRAVDRLDLRVRQEGKRILDQGLGRVREPSSAQRTSGHQTRAGSVYVSGATLAVKVHGVITRVVGSFARSFHSRLRLFRRVSSSGNGVNACASTATMRRNPPRVHARLAGRGYEKTRMLKASIARFRSREITKRND
jgi:hypothetical protein